MPSHETHPVRIAWWASFVATVTLIAILGIARSAQALTVPPAGGIATAATLVPPAGEEPEDEEEAGEDEESEAEECEEENEGEEECEEEADEAPQECLLSSARATVLASTAHDKVRLLVYYTMSSPTAVAVEYGLHGAKGSLYLGDEKKHFARKGVLRLTKPLTDIQMGKVIAAKGFTVRLHVPAAPSYCRPFFDRQLNVRRATPSGLAWSQAE